MWVLLFGAPAWGADDLSVLSYEQRLGSLTPQTSAPHFQNFNLPVAGYFADGFAVRDCLSHAGADRAVATANRKVALPI